jgi:hypothetical protein
MGDSVVDGASVGGWDLMVWTLSKPTKTQVTIAKASLPFTCDTLQVHYEGLPS